MAVYTLERDQLLKATLAEVWNFISSPENLKTITPDYMGFDILSENPLQEMYEGMIIRYKVSPLLGIKTTWVTEITHIRHQQFFIDEQRIGPYKLWHHQHHIKETPEGILMKDIVHYSPPFGFLGAVANSLMIKSKLNEIFDYRWNKLEEIFPV
ncbi:SRPBCC family protein [Marinoscillum sp. MHG1-6]|uniref:SRPBCC family protein n=1 Tax=Marinoscillum sp. MHG1-6 TaxID=2959627 RepID=UPI002157FBE9|nr:SRPBCC family protein [Marinoscillum sp. MHG1-6]